MLLCFGSRRRAANQETHWDEKYLLLDDESQIIPNPYFLDTGKITRHLLCLLKRKITTMLTNTFVIS